MTTKYMITCCDEDCNVLGEEALEADNLAHALRLVAHSTIVVGDMMPPETELITIRKEGVE